MTANCGGERNGDEVKPCDNRDDAVIRNEADNVRLHFLVGWRPTTNKRTLAPFCPGVFELSPIRFRLELLLVA